MDCNNQLNPFGAAQNGGGLYPNGCLILNPSSPGCCPSSDFELLVDDTLVPAGGDAAVAITPNKFVTQPCPPVAHAGKTSCIYRSMIGIRFDLEFAATTVTWSGFAADIDHQIPFSETATGPGSVHIDLGSYADASWVNEITAFPAQPAGFAHFSMSEVGGTAIVTLRNIHFRDYDPLIEYSLDDQSFLISTDPAVAVESLSLGALKARY